MLGSAADRQDGATLGDQAIDWIVHLRSGRVTRDGEAAFAAWRRQSAAHEAAACDAEALWCDLGATPTAAAHARQGGRARPRATHAKPAGRPCGSRAARRWVLAGAIAACLAVAVVGSDALGPVSGLFADYATLPGQRRAVRLPDGSTATLNTATALSVAYSDSERRLVLHDGEAYFDVEADSGRPFVVAAASGEVRALGTAFAVRHEAAQDRVVVSEGEVQLRPAASESQPIALRAGQQARFDARGVQQAEEIDSGAAIAWTRGKLVFNKRPLVEVAAELGRYRAGRIVVADSDLEGLQVSGVFDLNNPDAALRSLERILGIDILRLPLVVVIR